MKPPTIPKTQADAIRAAMKLEHDHHVVDRTDRALHIAAVIILVLAAAYFITMITIGLLR